MKKLTVGNKTIEGKDGSIVVKEARELFTILDIETTGLDANECQIIELAAIQTDLVKEIGRMEMRIALNEGQTVSDFIQELTGITNEDLAGGYPEQSAAIMFGLFAVGTTVVIQNASFDLSFLDKFGVNPPLFLCTRAMAHIAEPNESASLKNVSKRWGIEYKGHHRAINDCVMTVEILREALRKLEAKGIRRREYQNLVIDSAERPLRFKPKNARVGEINEDGRLIIKG